MKQELPVTHIRPQKSWFELGWGDVWQYRDLVAIFVRRDIVATYKQTVLGPLWYFISPILTTFIFTFVFGSVAKIPTSNIPGPVFYLSGLTLWNYFQSCFTGASSTFTANAALFGKVYFPRLASPLALVISNLVKFGIQFSILIAFSFIYHAKGAFVWSPDLHILLLPVLVALMALLGLGAGILISSLTTKYRDLAILVSFGTGLLMYITPVIYPMEALPIQGAWIIGLNPISPLVESFRTCFLGVGELSWGGLAYSGGFTLVLLVMGSLLFNRTEKSFMDTV